jgi:hypothetical protein
MNTLNELHTDRNTISLSKGWSHGHTSKLTERETGRFVAVVDYSQLFYEHSLYNNVEKIGIKS